MQVFKECLSPTNPQKGGALQCIIFTMKEAKDLDDNLYKSDKKIKPHALLPKYISYIHFNKTPKKAKNTNQSYHTTNFTLGPGWKLHS
jgi:hypothetical protein